MSTDIERVWITNMINKSAKTHGIDPIIFTAICKTESALNTHAIRFEPGYKWLYKVKDYAAKYAISEVTEGALQSFSYGLAQVMGAVMREYGYVGPLNAIIHQWDLSLDYGALHFSKKLKQYGNTDDAIAAYNAGSARKLPNGEYVNHEYIKKVHSHLTS